jgi:putative endonuclease
VKTKRKETGDLGEKLAREYIETRGYSVIETNFRSPGGEIDIVAKQGDTLVFVEVRTKRSRAFGTAEESVTLLKKRHLIDSADYYYQNHAGLPSSYRIDFVAIELGSDDLPTRISLIENAVNGE